MYIGKPEWIMISDAVRRVCGHCGIAPKDVRDQSCAAIKRAISPVGDAPAAAAMLAAELITLEQATKWRRCAGAIERRTALAALQDPDEALRTGIATRLGNLISARASRSGTGLADVRRDSIALDHGVHARVPAEELDRVNAAEVDQQLKDGTE
jgi:hypothetical protein